MANRNVYPNCVLIILSNCYIRFIVIFQIFNFVLAFSTFSVAFLFCLLQTSFGKVPERHFSTLRSTTPAIYRSNLISSSWIWLEFKLIQYFMAVLVDLKSAIHQELKGTGKDLYQSGRDIDMWFSLNYGRRHDAHGTSRLFIQT